MGQAHCSCRLWHRGEQPEHPQNAIQLVTQLAGHEMSETDPELGSNLMFFFFQDWKELCEVPNLDRLVPNLDALTSKLQAKEANQYRLFRFDAKGGIKACFVFCAWMNI